MSRTINRTTTQIANSSLAPTNDTTSFGKNLDVMGWAFWHLTQVAIPVSDAVAPTVTAATPPSFE